jgi:hypothetical protein
MEKTFKKCLGEFKLFWEISNSRTLKKSLGKKYTTKENIEKHLD